jgi:hypothetical protein
MLPIFPSNGFGMNLGLEAEAHHSYVVSSTYAPSQRLHTP